MFIYFIYLYLDTISLSGEIAVLNTPYIILITGGSLILLIALVSVLAFVGHRRKRRARRDKTKSDFIDPTCPDNWIKHTNAHKGDSHIHEGLSAGSHCGDYHWRGGIDRTFSERPTDTLPISNPRFSSGSATIFSNPHRFPSGTCSCGTEANLDWHHHGRTTIPRPHVYCSSCSCSCSLSGLGSRRCSSIQSAPCAASRPGRLTEHKSSPDRHQGSRASTSQAQESNHGNRRLLRYNTASLRSSNFAYTEEFGDSDKFYKGTVGV